MTPGIRDFLITFGGRLATLLAMLGTQSCLAWVLGPADRGSYAVCMLLASLLTVVFAIGCDTAAEYYVASKKASVSQVVTSLLVLGGGGAALAILAGEVLLQTPLALMKKASVTEIQLGLLLIPVGFLSVSIANLLNPLREFFWSAVFSVTAVLVQLALTLVFLLVFPWRVTGALLATLATAAGTLVAAVVFLRRRHHLRLVLPSMRCLGGMLHYGLRYYVGKLSNETNLQVGAILLALFASPEEIGIFSVAAMSTTRVLMVPDALGTVLLPRVAIDAGGRAELVARSARVVTILCGGALLALGVLAHPIVAILFSPKFLPMVPLIWILCLGVWLRSGSKTFVPYLTGTDRPGTASVAVVVGVGVNLALVLALMPSMGMAGAAVAMTAGYVVSSIILTATFRRHSRLAMGAILRPRRADWAPVVSFWRRLRGLPQVTEE